MESISAISAAQPSEFVILSEKVRRSATRELVLESVKNESGRVSNVTLTLQSANPDLYTARGALEHIEMKSSRFWLA